MPGFRDRAGEHQHYDGETPDQRKARRISKWTPTEIVWMGADGAGAR